MLGEVSRMAHEYAWTGRRLERGTMKNFLMVGAMLAGLSLVPVIAADLSECAVVADDTKRLACYDALAKAASPAARSQKDREEASLRNEIIDRCQTQMGSYGASMVKACVDQDLEAYEELQKLIPSHSSIIDRCEGQMGSFGWSMVLACTEQDIEAARALERMRN